MNEIWKDIEGYEGLYQVSNLGRVKSLCKTLRRFGRDVIYNEHILNSALTKNGYLHIVINKKSEYIHRLVAKAFLSNPHNLPQINHKNEDKTDNRFENLEWCTSKYNANYGERNKKAGLGHAKTIYQFTIDGEFIKEWISGREVERQLGFTQSAISACCRGKQKTAYGFIWKFTKD